MLSDVDRLRNWSRVVRLRGAAWPKKQAGRGRGSGRGGHHIQLTPNQVVAYNLAQARLWKDWTQEEAAEHLGRTSARDGQGELLRRRTFG